MRDDLWHISGYPFIPGHEVVGVVAKVGPGVPHSCAMVGMRVGVGWIKESCRCCQRCTRGEENLCLSAGSYKGLIVGRDSKGGFADYLRCSADFVYAIPDGLASAHAAPLLCAGITVYAPLRRYLRPGMRCAVVGIGGLGHLALQFADALGASSVTAVDIDATKGKEASSLKATSFVHWSAFLTGTSQCGAPLFGAFDVILNCASASLDVAALLRALAPGGTLIQVGCPGGDALMPVPLLDLVFGQKQVVGSIVGGRADMREMFTLASAKGVVPMVERFPLSQVNEAMERLAQGLARYRIVLLSDEAWRQEVRGSEGREE